MSWIGPVIVVLVVPLALSILLRAAQVPAKIRDGKKWAQYGLRFKIFAFIFMLIPAAFGVLWFNVGSEMKLTVFIILLIFAGIGIPLFLEAFFVKIGFDDSSVHCYSPWRRNRTINISDIGSPFFSESMRWWEIPTKTQGEIRVQSFLSGASDLIKKIQG